MEPSNNKNKNMSSFFERLSETTKTYPASNMSQLENELAIILVKGRKIEFNRKDKIFYLK